MTFSAAINKCLMHINDELKKCFCFAQYAENLCKMKCIRDTKTGWLYNVLSLKIDKNW